MNQLSARTGELRRDELIREAYRTMPVEQAMAFHERMVAGQNSAGEPVSRCAREPVRRFSIFPPRRVQRPRDPSKVLRRRRKVAASGAMPPAIAALFTPGETAALSIIAMEIRQRGHCTLCNDEVAAKAGVSRSTVKNALRQAKQHGLIRVTERPRKGMKNDTNVVEIVSGEWSTWLRRDGPVEVSEDRGQTADHHEYLQYLKQPGMLVEGRKRHHLHGVTAPARHVLSVFW